MESSQLFGGAEESQSSESGWTMYIGSPIHGGDADGAHSDNDDGDDDGAHSDNDDGDDDYSDDSMASDASSGPPSHQGHPFGNREGITGHGMAHLKHEDDGDVKCFYDKKANKKPIMEKQRAEKRRKEEKEEMVFMAERGSSTATAQSGSKGRKNIRRSQRK